MKLRQLLTASITLLSTHAAFAGEPIFPQPIDVSATVGTEQSDFFLLRYAKGTKLVFSALVKEVAATKTKPTMDQRALFSQIIESLGGPPTHFAVDKSAPLAKLTTFTLPTGTVFDNFLFNGNAENEQVMQGLPQEYFHVPTKGIYASTGGSAPVIVRAETAAAITSGFALQNPNFTANDKDNTEAFRVVLGANDPKKGYEAFVSQGSGAATALNIQGGTAPVLNPSSFTTFTDSNSQNAAQNVVYFLGQNAAGGNFVYKTMVDTTHSKAVYSAVQVTATSLTAPSDLTGSNDGLIYTDSINGTRQLLLSSDGTDSFATVPGAGTDPKNIVPNVVTGLDGIGNTNTAGTGFTALDSQSRRRFQVVSNLAGALAVFQNSSATQINPTGIISTGSYFFYSAIDTTFDTTTRFAIKDFNGSTDNQHYLTDENGNFLVSPQEFTFIHGPGPSGLDGTVYFTAQLQTDVLAIRYLWKIPANDTTAAATSVRTVADQADRDNATATPSVPITSAHNLRNVSDNTIFRLYFCAPVTDTENSQWRPLVKVGKTTGPASVGTKPWVLSDQ